MVYIYILLGFLDTLKVTCLLHEKERQGNRNHPKTIMTLWIYKQ